MLRISSRQVLVVPLLVVIGLDLGSCVLGQRVATLNDSRPDNNNRTLTTDN
jgi:hypothetical protein